MPVAENRHKTRKQVLAFVPRHCPYPRCPDHMLDESEPYRFLRRGTRTTNRKPGLVCRYTCGRCGRSFSSSVFFDLYRRRHRDIPEAVFLGLCEGQSARQVARTTGYGLKLVQGLQRRMARQAVCFHQRQLDELEGQVDSEFGYDGLVTFAGSQWEPGDLQTAVHSELGFLFDVDYVGRRRSGRMTPRQRAIRELRERVLGRPRRGVGVRKTREALLRLSRLTPEGMPLRLNSDKHVETERAVRQARARGVAIEHTTVSSRARRDQSGHPLWQINHEHRVMRHSLKNLARETIAFSKTAAGLMDRVWIYVAWRNNVKGISERHGRETSETTPAMLLGLADAPLSVDDIFHRRLFPKRVGLPKELRDHYDGVVRSRPHENANTYRYKTPSAH